MTLPRRTLVLGGAASGKSLFAEGLVRATGATRVYLATAQAFDDEMAEKIAAHRIQRGPDWITLEAPRAIASPLAACTADQVVLLDCATLWLSNVLLAGAEGPEPEDAFVQAVAACPARVVVVSNETGQGIVPETPLGRQFRNAQGRLNQRLAGDCDLVVGVMAGLPFLLKGQHAGLSAPVPLT